MNDVASRRLAAEMLLQALRALEPLLHTKSSASAFHRTRETQADLSDKQKLKIQSEDYIIKEQYFESVESLVWIYSPGSDQYFDILDLDPDVCRSKLDLGFYADLALTQYYENKDFMLRMYIAMAKYSFDERAIKKGSTEKIPFEVKKRFAEDALAYTTSVLEEIRSVSPKNGSRGSKLPSIIAALSQVEEPAAALRTA